jgi:hypothetical protein
MASAIWLVWWLLIVSYEPIKKCGISDNITVHLGVGSMLKPNIFACVVVDIPKLGNLTLKSVAIGIDLVEVSNLWLFR